MPAAPADSALYAGLLGDAQTAVFFSDAAEIEAMLLVEGALARVQGELGLIPQESAAIIDAASRSIAPDPSALAAETAVNGVPVPGLIAAFRKAMNAPEHAQYVHWGATSQDIMDTALALRLKQVLPVWEARLDGLLQQLARLAETHAELPMAARTYGQAATPTSFGAVAASWGRPLLRWRARLEALKPDLLQVSLSGAAGTLSAMGPQGPKIRAALAQTLGLSDPGSSWHSERDGIAAFASWMAGLAASLGKMGEDLILLTQSGIGEVTISGAGGSSTMPQKQNPVAPSVLSAIARQCAGLAGILLGAGVHRQQRDGAAWFAEWLTLPQLCVSTGRALAAAGDLANAMSPDPEAMARGLSQGHGLIFAEALSFALTDRMPRPQAQAAVKALCAEALRGEDLLALAARDFPGTEWHHILRKGMLGQAPAEASHFAGSVPGRRLASP